jgi:hypothetical protein
MAVEEKEGHDGDPVKSILSAILDLEKIPARVVCGLLGCWIIIVSLPEYLLKRWHLDRIPDDVIGWMTIVVLALICVQIAGTAHGVIARRRDRKAAAAKKRAFEEGLEQRLEALSDREAGALAECFFEPQTMDVLDPAVSSLMSTGLLEQTARNGMMERGASGTFRPHFNVRIRPSFRAAIQRELVERGLIG